MPMNPRLRSRVAMTVLAGVFLLLASPDAFARRGRGGGGGGDDDDNGGGGNGALTLRVNDAIAAPGGTVAVVLRTYAPRPVRQGQIAVRIRRPPKSKLGLSFEEVTQPARPFMTMISAVVYSTQGDSKSQASLTGQADSQTAKVQFESPSGSVNASDGPLAVFRFRLDPRVQPGQSFELQIDPAATNLVDSQGRPVTLEPRPAFLTVRAPRAPFLLEAEGDKVEPGETAELGVQTFEPFPVKGGRVTFRYNRRLAGGDPVVRMDQRYGKSTFTVDRSTPGVLVVNFTSPDGTLNTVPGNIVAIDLPISPAARIGVTAPVTLDPAGTWLLSRKGRKLKVRIENGELEIR